MRRYVPVHWFYFAHFSIAYSLWFESNLPTLRPFFLWHNFKLHYPERYFTNVSLRFWYTEDDRLINIIPFCRLLSPFCSFFYTFDVSGCPYNVCLYTSILLTYLCYRVFSVMTQSNISLIVLSYVLRILFTRLDFGVIPVYSYSSIFPSFQTNAISTQMKSFSYSFFFAYWSSCI